MAYVAYKHKCAMCVFPDHFCHGVVDLICGLCVFPDYLSGDNDIMQERQGRDSIVRN